MTGSTRSAEARRRRGKGRLASRTVAGLASTLALLALGAAGAAAQPAHVFNSSFGEAGSGAGQFGSPGGVAVNETSGEVYVADTANNRVDVFGAEGKFIEAWGWGVTDGAKEYEQCTSTCLPGIAGTGKGQLKGPEAIAIDNSGKTPEEDPSVGRVYVGNGLNIKNLADVQRFSASGEALGKLPLLKETEGNIDGIGVDSRGFVWVDRVLEGETSEVEGFNNKLINKSLENTFGPEVTCGRPGFGVVREGEEDSFYVDHQREVAENGCATSTGEPTVTAKVKNGGEVVYQAADSENTTGVAVDPVTAELLIDNVGSVALFSSSGQFIERFGEGHLTAGAALAINSKTRIVYVAEPSANRIDIFTQPPAAPVVQSVSARSLSTSSEQLSAQIDPSGADTHYYFQYGTTECKASPSSCTDVPAPPGTDLGSSFFPQTASVSVSGLQPSTVYYYRVLAQNTHGTAEESGSFTTLPSAAGVLADNRAWELVSPAEKFGASIEPIGAKGAPQGGLIQAAESGGAITYVANGPFGTEPEGNRAPESAQILSKRSSGGWSSQDIVTPHNLVEGLAAGEPGEYRLFSSDLSAAILQPFGIETITHLQEPPLVPGVTSEQRGLYRRNNITCPSTCYQPLVTGENDTGNKEFGGLLEFVGGTPDANHVVFRTTKPLSLISGNPEEESALYEWSASEPRTLKPVNVLPDEKLQSQPEFGTEVGAGRSSRNAISSDGSKVVWSNARGGAPANRLYMRDTATGETVQLNKVAEGSGLSEIPEEEELPELDHVVYQFASADGSKVFFTDNARLTLSSHLEPTEEASPSDLYECEMVVVAGKLKCNLTDLTTDQNAGQGAGVQGGLLGGSEDGSYLYFVANGALTPDAQPGNCGTGSPSSQCNLYVYGPDPRHPGQVSTRLIARLTGEDSPVWLGGGETDLPRLFARVSPKGGYVAFMSNSKLTGYENVDANPAAKGAHDEEVFVYNAATELLSCASCNPNGQPKGVFDSEFAGEGNGLLVEREGAWKGKWLAGSLPGWTGITERESHHQSRYLSDEGRLFFNSADALVSPAHGAVTSRSEVIEGKETSVGVENVYEYEPAGLGSCAHGAACISLISSGTSKHESAFMDASTNGEDAFFITSVPLVPAEHETNFSLYDARVCSSASPCINSEVSNPQPCESTESCRPGNAPHTTFGTPSTGSSQPPETAPGQGTLPNKVVLKPKPLTRAQKLALALKSCRKKYKGKHKHKKRHVCEKTAYKHYGPPKHKAKKK